VKVYGYDNDYDDDYYASESSAEGNNRNDDLMKMIKGLWN
jgi:hypothetical protein